MEPRIKMMSKDVPVVGISAIHPASDFFVPVTCSGGVLSHVGKRSTAGQWHVDCQVARFGGRATGIPSSLAVAFLASIAYWQPPSHPNWTPVFLPEVIPAHCTG